MHLHVARAVRGGGPDGPTDVVVFSDGTPSHHRWSTRGREDQCCRVPHSRFGACLLFQLEWRCDALTTPGAVARVLHRLRGRRATFRDETLPLVDTADEVREQGPPGEFDRSRLEGTELASGTANLSPGLVTCGLSATRRIPTLERAWIFAGSLFRWGITVWLVALKVSS